MTMIPRRRYWPFDEVTASRDPLSRDRFLISAPWLKFHVDVEPRHSERAAVIAEKLSTGQLGAEDLNDINWLFASLAKYPLAYILPRADEFGTDDHQVLDQALTLNSPLGLLMSHEIASTHREAFERLAKRTLTGNWTWDTSAALEFAKSATGYDPETLFSVARRFHLLNDLEQNQTGAMLEYVTGLKSDPTKFRSASALIARQNHYITEMCDPVLRGALPLAQNAIDEVRDFIQAESGHDKIVAKAIRSLGAEPSDVPLVDSVVVLMDVFGWVAKRNLLGFAMIVDIFERTSYKKEDPFAEALTAGGEVAAARQIDVHREINDAGEHENVALGFLQFMKPVDETYALEALRYAELATLVIHQMSAETLDLLRA